MRVAVKLAAGALALTFLSGTAFSQDKVRIGTEGAYPPFNFIDSDGQLQGFDIDIAKALCEEMGAECEFVAQDWDGIIPALIANKYDAIIASMSITEERKEKVDFTNKYYSTPPAMIAAKDTDLASADPADLAGKAVGAQSATTHATFLEDKYTDSSVKLYATQDEANLDLISGRLDAILADSVVMTEWLKTEDGACCKVLATLPQDPAYFGEGAGIAIRKGEDELREKFNAAIEGIVASGKYKEINDKYFEFSVY